MDADHYFGGDISFSDSLDMGLVDGIVATQQAIIRRLLTNPGEYIWHPTYGAGVGRYIGASDTDLDDLKADILDQLAQEDLVASSPAPIVDLVSSGTNLYVNVQYTDAGTDSIQVVTLNLP